MLKRTKIRGRSEGVFGSWTTNPGTKGEGIQEKRDKGKKKEMKWKRGGGGRTDRGDRKVRGLRKDLLQIVKTNGLKKDRGTDGSCRKNRAHQTQNNKRRPER